MERSGPTVSIEQRIETVQPLLSLTVRSNVNLCIYKSIYSLQNIIT